MATQTDGPDPSEECPARHAHDAAGSADGDMVARGSEQGMESWELRQCVVEGVTDDADGAEERAPAESLPVS